MPPRSHACPGPTTRTGPAPLQDNAPPPAPLNHTTTRCSQASIPAALDQPAATPQTLEHMGPAARPAMPLLAPAAAIHIPLLNAAGPRAPSPAVIQSSITAATSQVAVTRHSAPPQLPSPPQPPIVNTSSVASPPLSTAYPPPASTGQLTGSKATHPKLALPASSLSSATSNTVTTDCAALPSSVDASGLGRMPAAPSCIPRTHLQPAAAVASVVAPLAPSPALDSTAHGLPNPAGVITAS